MAIAGPHQPTAAQAVNLRMALAAVHLSPLHPPFLGNPHPQPPHPVRRDHVEDRVGHALLGIAAGE